LKRHRFYWQLKIDKLLLLYLAAYLSYVNKIETKNC